MSGPKRLHSSNSSSPLRFGCSSTRWGTPVRLSRLLDLVDFARFAQLNHPLRRLPITAFGHLTVALILAALTLLSAPAFAADSLSELDEDSKWQLKGEAKARLQNVEQMLNDWDIAGARRELEAAEKIAPKDIEPIHYFKGRVLFEETS
jgi:hypothetical protein